MNQTKQEQINIVLAFHETDEEKQRGLGVAGELKIVAGEIFQQHLEESLRQLGNRQEPKEFSKQLKTHGSVKLRETIERAIQDPAQYLTFQLSYEASQVKFVCKANEAKLNRYLQEPLKQEFKKKGARFTLPGITFWIVTKVFKLNDKALDDIHDQIVRRVAHNLGNDLVRHHKQNLLQICQEFVPQMEKLTKQFAAKHQATTVAPCVQMDGDGSNTKVNNSRSPA